jgi:hypothetical protein
MVRCPNCGQQAEGDYCRWCGYPIMAGGDGEVEAGKARKAEGRESRSKLKGSLKGCGCLIVVAAIVGIIIAINSNGDSNYIHEDGAILVGGDNEPIELINNSSATNPTYAELTVFIEKDPTDKRRYLPFSYICSDFAEDVHNNAEEAGIRAAWVGIDFEGQEVGHALNAFETTDRGLVYIDCTGQSIIDELQYLSAVESEEGLSIIYDSSTNWDAIAYIEVGKEYGLIPIAKAGSPSYSFYEEYKQKWQEYEELASEYNAEVIQYNEEISGKIYFEGSSELAMIEAWEDRLEEQAEVLDELGKELSDYWFEPLGVVEEIYMHW